MEFQQDSRAPGAMIQSEKKPGILTHTPLTHATLSFPSVDRHPSNISGVTPFFQPIWLTKGRYHFLLNEFAQHADLFKSRRNTGGKMTRLHKQCWRCEYFSQNLPDHRKAIAKTSREACARLQDISAPPSCPDFTSLEDIKGKVLHVKDRVSGKWTEVSG